MAATRILLAPGASGTIERLRDHERGCRRGFDVRGRASKGGARMPSGYTARAREEDAAATVIGGIRSGAGLRLLAAERAVAALVLLCDPPTPPDGREAWEERTSHWRYRVPGAAPVGRVGPIADLASCAAPSIGFRGPS